MCTVTYVPTSNGFFITQNRDVEPTRFAREIVEQSIDDQQVVFPKDPVAGGTWLTISSRDLFLCVMNGAFRAHEMGGYYRKSRGLIALEIHNYASAAAFFEEILLADIEPFTMVVYERGHLFEFRWDGQQKYLLQMDMSVPHIWGSSSLYTPHWQARRQFWFNQWLAEKPNPARDDIIEFHTKAGDGDPQNDLVMNRSDLVATVSICCVEKTSLDFKLQLISLAGAKEMLAHLAISKATLT